LAVKRFGITRGIYNTFIRYSDKIEEKLLQDELSALGKPALLLHIIFPNHCPISYLNRTFEIFLSSRNIQIVEDYLLNKKVY